jgi:hypothetical protein
MIMLKSVQLSSSTWKNIRFFQAFTWSDLIENPKGKYNLPGKKWPQTIITTKWILHNYMLVTTVSSKY